MSKLARGARPPVKMSNYSFVKAEAYAGPGPLMSKRAGVWCPLSNAGHVGGLCQNVKFDAHGHVKTTDALLSQWSKVGQNCPCGERGPYPYVKTT